MEHCVGGVCEGEEIISGKVRLDMERYLVGEKGYSKDEIEVDRNIEITLGWERLVYRADLVVRADDRAVMVVSCSCGGLGVKERMTMAVARLVEPYQVPMAVLANEVGEVELLDVASGKVIGEGHECIPARDELDMGAFRFPDISEKTKEMEMKILAGFEAVFSEKVC